MNPAQPIFPFRVHLSVLIDGRMARTTVDVRASNAIAARGQVLAQPAFKDAIILKTKKVRT